MIGKTITDATIGHIMIYMINIKECDRKYKLQKIICRFKKIKIIVGNME